MSLIRGYELVATIIGALLLLHGLITITCLEVAIKSLRAPLESETYSPRAVFQADGNEYWQTLREERASATHVSGSPKRRLYESVEERIVKPPKLRPLPEIEGDPLIWKEMNTGGKIIAFSPAFWVPLGSLLIPLLVIFLFILIGGSHEGRSLDNELGSYNVLIRLTLMLLGGLFCMGVAYRTCGSVARERQQGTLDALLMLPIPRQDILKSKWIGAMYKGWGCGALFLPVLLVGLLAGVLHVMGAIFLLLAVLVHAAFLASLGLFLSVVSPRVLTAQTRMALFLFLILLALVLNLFFNFSPGWINFGNLILNPMAQWNFLCMTPHDWNHSSVNTEGMAATLIGLGFYAVAAGIFWSVTCRLFESERFRKVD